MKLKCDRERLKKLLTLLISRYIREILLRFTNISIIWSIDVRFEVYIDDIRCQSIRIQEDMYCIKK